MKLKFSSELQYQIDAVNAVVSAFEGLPLAAGVGEVSTASTGVYDNNELARANRFAISAEQVLGNVRKVQTQNKIAAIEQLKDLHFSIEMETGTGKTYVYLRTIFELWQQYGFCKFIIVVPSVAIREGVLKSIELMSDHFATIFKSLRFSHFVYDSKDLGHVINFADSTQLKIMVINIQSFIKDVPDKESNQMTEDELKKLNVIYRDNDRLKGYKPIEFIQHSRPVVVIDEPQNMETEKARNAIASLNPAFTLRYSATHRTQHNLLYRLDPIQAYRMKLVKQIEVASVRSGVSSFNDAYVKLLQTDNTKSIRAQVEIHVQDKKGDVKPKKIWVKQHDNLYPKSDNREIYMEGYVIRNIDTRPGAEYIEFGNGERVSMGAPIGSIGEDIMRHQVRETVKQHLDKEKQFQGMGIKVLSLFFIDRVANYRQYLPNGQTALGKIGEWFEQAYQELTEGEKAPYAEFAASDLSRIHNGYFSKDKKGIAKDTSGGTRDDEDTYSLIMRDKERLLDLAEPLRFIFSHSALREGWDNPNIFQICTLNESQSVIKKRQEIGRGLRLPVNDSGERIQDERINRLTIIANESYDVFAQKLQQEMQEETGVQFGKVDTLAFADLVREDADGKEVKLGQAESRKIWNAVQQADFISLKGEVQKAFQPQKPEFFEKMQTAMPEEFKPLTAAVIDVIGSFMPERNIRDASKKIAYRYRKEILLDENFLALWEQIKHKTRYRVKYETSKIIERAANRMKDLDYMPTIHAPDIQIDLVGIDVGVLGVRANRRLAMGSENVNTPSEIPDLMNYLQKKTELTRSALLAILERSGRLQEFVLNPQMFMTHAGRCIAFTLSDLSLEGIQYDKVEGYYWDQKLLEEDDKAALTRYIDRLYTVQNGEERSLAPYVEYDSEVERKFAQDLDNNQNIAFFMKLPAFFKVETPIGAYNPDWAFITKGENRLYFVRETKSSLLPTDRRESENQKIKCGKVHFEAIGVDFDTVTHLGQVKLT